jgi:2-methylisocitrate lyase-like PEP mutase family enzyme
MADHSEIGSAPVHDFEAFAKAGFDMVLVPLSGFLAGLKAMRSIYARLFAERTWRGYEGELIDLPQYNAWAGRIVDS